MLSASSRLLRLLALLQTRGHWAGQELAEQLAIHPRTLRRDIERLRELGYPIQASTGVAGGYAFRPGQVLPPLLLEDDEALAVAIALRTAASGMVRGMEETSLRAVVKLEQVMPARLRKRVDALRTAVQPMDRPGPLVDASVLATLAGACRDQLRLSFAYTDIRGAVSARTVEPQGVVHTGSRWYLVAWDPSREDWRTFRIDRMAEPLDTGNHFAPRVSPDGGDLRAFVSRSLAVSPYPAQVRIVLHAPLEAMVQRIPPSAGFLEGLDANPDRCLVHFGIQSLDTVVHWLLALNVDFEVLEPLALKDRLRAVAERVARSVGTVSG